MDALEVEKLTTMAELTISSALLRKESRRAHYRCDFPEANNRDWLKNIIVRKGERQAEFSTAVPVMHRLEPPREEGAEDSHSQ